MQGQGLVYCFGFGKAGELGNNSRNDREIIPFRITGVPACQSVSAGSAFSLILTQTGEIWASGKSKNGRSGSRDSTSFVRISSLPRITQISAGYWHSLALDDSNHIWATGYNSYGQLGLGHTTNQPTFTATNVAATLISAGGHYSLAISPSGQILTCGTSKINGHGQDVSVFRAIENLDAVEHIDAGQIHAACVSRGRVFTWGNNTWGQLGHSKQKNSKVPLEVNGLQGLQIVSVSCSKGEKYGSTGCIDREHHVLMWGCGYKGKLGLDQHWSHEDPADRLEPEMIKDFSADTLELGGIHSICITNGVIYTWGCGSDGRIGHPEVEGHRYLYKEPLPRPIENLPRVVKISSSYYHNIFVTE